MRKTFSVWGQKGEAKKMTDGAIIVGDDGVEGSIRRRIERVTGCKVVGFRNDGNAMKNGVVESTHYEATLGRALSAKSGGGWSVEGSLWVAVQA